MKFNLVWGNSEAVRNAFMQFQQHNSLYTLQDMKNLGYPPHEGDQALIDTTHEVVKRQVGKDYNHIILVNGATGGVTIALRAYAQKGHKTCLTDKPPYFSLYPDMIAASGLQHVANKNVHARGSNSPVILVDSPSNPKNESRIELRDIYDTPIIWDAVYHSEVYAKVRWQPDHDVSIGSYSKLTGLNGIRVGWIATNDGMLAHRIKNLVTAEYCGISGVSMHILNLALRDFPWPDFEVLARANLDANRAEWQKLSKFFGGQEPSSNGAFFYGPMDKTAQKLFTKASVLWTPGSNLGHSDDFARFNIGADPALIKMAVSEILKIDKIK